MKNPLSKILVISLLIVLLFSCEKDPVIEPIMHNSEEFDLNDDLTNDIKIFYRGYTWDGIGPDGTGMGISGILEPLNRTMILYKKDIGSLFLKSNDTIKLLLPSPLSWISSDSYLINIKTHLNQYVNPWTVSSPEVKDQYVLGFKIASDNCTTLGWLKLKIDRYNGEISITEKKLSNSDHLVID